MHNCYSVMCRGDSQDLQSTLRIVQAMLFQHCWSPEASDQGCPSARTQWTQLNTKLEVDPWQKQLFLCLTRSTCRTAETVRIVKGRGRYVTTPTMTSPPTDAMPTSRPPHHTPPGIQLPAYQANTPAKKITQNQTPNIRIAKTNKHKTTHKKKHKRIQ